MSRDRHGFTLLELVVVVAILGLLGMVAIPSYGAGDENKLDLVEIQVRDAFSHAMALARSTRQTHAVLFDPATDRFAVLDQDGVPVSDPLSKGDYVIDFERPGQPGNVDIVSAAFGANGAAALFDGQGLPVESGTVELGVRAARRTLALNRATGRVTVP